MGHLIMQRCTDLAIEKAKANGIGWVGCCYGNHAGAGSMYTNLVAEAGLVGLYLAVGSANHMAPWGGIDMLLSTNPIAISVPMGEGKPPVLLDMATTVAAYGKVKMKAQLRSRNACGLDDWISEATSHRSKSLQRRHVGANW
jgi:LDH2 family malate/lactate/ureidoglycolate dehydrogenase